MVIRNGIVVDGFGAHPVPADFGINGGRILKIGMRIPEKGSVEIDADGHVVTPGFIDGHTHMDAQIMWDPLGSCSCWHGVTSVVMGNCGFTLAGRGGLRGRSSCATSSAPRTSRPRRWRRASTLDLGDLLAQYLDAVGASEGDQLRRLRRPLRAPHLGDGRARRSS